MKYEKNIPAIVVKQWLSSWDSVVWQDNDLRRQPLNKQMLVFSISAKLLKMLSGVYKRDEKTRQFASDDWGIQRKHDPERSKVIQEFVKNGYPWSELSASKKESRKFDDLKKPGWLPTAIVLNILTEKDTRRSKKVGSNDLLKLTPISNKLVDIELPEGVNDPNYKFQDLPPIEIIDGQHRLWAFDFDSVDEDYELPVVAFQGLGLSWQAYLFYTINISPKKINRSLAFDLYPLLRNEEWLERFDGHSVYRETRAQELVDILNSHPKSPWLDGINMLGDSGANSRKVSQSAWIRSLIATLVKPAESRKRTIGGLFGAPLGEDETMLPWGKEEQAAVLIYYGMQLNQHLQTVKPLWEKSLGKEKSTPNSSNTVAAGMIAKDSLLNQDQGIRAILHIFNDFLFINFTHLQLERFYIKFAEGNVIEIIDVLLTELRSSEIGQYLSELTDSIVRYDWRSFSAVSETESSLRMKKAAFRGSGGYKVLRQDLLEHMLLSEHTKISSDAKTVIDHL